MSLVEVNERHIPTHPALAAAEMMRRHYHREGRFLEPLIKGVSVQPSLDQLPEQIGQSCLVTLLEETKMIVPHGMV